ncbi:DUF3168 domain-containing protein [Pseudoprimorskyibacter insulae]|uniref:DUF3168 domain-containing protein n=1 Tax=Pseudoprimorskyibacter insulae TaxID=1695997 RepID=A0A2R8AXR1_9RHOB|nr:DUF3168 domain-containing protein [Pseudoprimorskyibacter insulae]SPF80832.1 hypothetical protein PRI8871_02644 [Pseudoprimorskyibacter insulae]
MSYAQSLALQTAIYDRLSAWSALSTVPVFDAAPQGTLPGLYVMIGAETVKDASDQTALGAWHDLEISIVTDGAGFSGAKQVAADVGAALEAPGLSLSAGRLVSLNFRRARARRETGGLRRIDLTFRARVDSQ